MKTIFVLSLICFFSKAAVSQTKIAAIDASKHIGDSVTIIDKVSGTKYLDGPGITLINLGNTSLDELQLIVVIRKDDAGKFRAKPEELFADKIIKITGKITEYNGQPIIIVSDPKQIEDVTKLIQPQQSKF